MTAKDRATNQVVAKLVSSTNKETQHRFTAEGTKVDTDQARVDKTLHLAHEAVKHSVGVYVRMQAQTNGPESFWAMIQCAHAGRLPKISPKHLNRNLQEFSGRHADRNRGTLEQTTTGVVGLVGKRLMHRNVIADIGLHS